jgi:HSP20 family molecular chaperone IbpA
MAAPYKLDRSTPLDGEEVKAETKNGKLYIAVPSIYLQEKEKER